MEAAFLLCAMALGAFFETVSIGVIFPFRIMLPTTPELFFPFHTGLLYGHVRILGWRPSRSRYFS
jgi:hypothetical protein